MSLETEKLTVEDFDWSIGITSLVETSELSELDDRDKNHLLMLDLDGVTEDRARQIVDHLPDGVYILQESSEGNYNVVSLNVFYFREVVEAQASVYEEDAQHLKIGVNRGKWVTRLSVKGPKDAPELVDAIVVGDYNSELYSKTHIDLFIEIYDCFDILPAIKNQYDSRIERIKYPTRAERNKEETEV